MRIIQARSPQIARTKLQFLGRILVRPIIHHGRLASLHLQQAEHGGSQKVHEIVNLMVDSCERLRNPQPSG
jgi:hypothetical protein